MENQVIVCATQKGNKWHFKQNGDLTFCGLRGTRMVHSPTQFEELYLPNVCKNCIKKYGLTPSKEER